MSAYGINKVCYLAQADPEFREQLRSEPTAALANLPLTDSEREALLTGDVAALHRMGGLDFLLSNLARFGSFGLTRDLYVERMRTLLTNQLVPDGIRACLFDLDGVLTQTARVHAAAWKQMFDAFLSERASRTGKAFRPFELPTDYGTYVDGKLRQDGVRSFLESRGIVLPEGNPDDPPTAESVHGLGTRKNDLVLELIRTQGVQTYPASVDYVEAVRDAGVRTAVVSASKNCREVLVAAGIEHLFEVRVDGIVAEQRGLRGKPAPDMFLAAAGALDTTPEESAVFEDALAGVEAGRTGGFGWVVGVDRVGHADALRRHGADVVVSDLSELGEKR